MATKQSNNSTNYLQLTEAMLPYIVRERDAQKTDIERDLRKAQSSLLHLRKVAQTHGIELTFYAIEQSSHGNHEWIRDHFMEASEAQISVLPKLLRAETLGRVHASADQVIKDFAALDYKLTAIGDTLLNPDTLEVRAVEEFIDRYATVIRTPAGMKLYNAQMTLFQHLEEFAELLPAEHRNHIKGGLRYHAARGIWNFDNLPSYDKIAQSVTSKK